MTGERYVVLGLAQVRSDWFVEVGRWATNGSVPVEFVKCVSAEEVRARLASTRRFSALVVDGSLPGLDRDLVDLATSTGCAVFVVADGRVTRDWSALGAAVTLAPQFTRDAFAAALASHASMVGPVEGNAPPGEDTVVTGWRGRLVGVVGSGGTGCSTVAMAVAQALADDVRNAGMVLLADLALDADQAMFHDTGEVVPGLQELVEAHRAGRLGSEPIRALVFDIAARRYHLLLGVRRHRDWAALRPRAVGAAVDGLRQNYRIVVADVDADIEGEDDCGSVDVEERNVLARTIAARADLLLVVTTPGAKGLLSASRIVDGLRRAGVEPSRVVPVINRAPRSPRLRSRLARTAAELASDASPALASPVFVPERRGLEETIGSARLPNALTHDIGAAVRLLLDRVAPRGRAAAAEPARVTPGRVGSWSGA